MTTLKSMSENDPHASLRSPQPLHSVSTPTVSGKSTALRAMLTSRNLDFLIEAHNGLAAKIAGESGFNGIWASGLAISASYGLRDNNEASWTQVLETLEFMSDASSIPILVDGDTGYGNFNNVRRLVRKLEQRNIAGVCIEDKVFPKRNSFIRGDTQPLAGIDEFCGKIKAGTDARTDDDFCIVARVEALITGWGMPEALRRAEAYRLAGADAILIHSRHPAPTEIEAFMAEWGNRHPVVIIPTMYYATPTEHFRAIGISMVIWANHLVRAAIKAMQDTCAQIFKEQSVAGIENHIAPVTEIFRLQGDEEMRDAEDRYLPRGRASAPTGPMGKAFGAAIRDAALTGRTARERRRSGRTHIVNLESCVGRVKRTGVPK